MVGLATEEKEKDGPPHARLLRMSRIVAL